LADALEAIIAAIYLEHGFETVEKFILNKVLPIMIEQNLLSETNYKSVLLEAVQALGYNAPVYILKDENGPSHDKTFIIAVVIDEKEIAIGSAHSKKEAEQIAAQNALQKIELLNK